MTETIVDLYRMGGIGKLQTLQGTAHGIKLPLNQHGIAPVLIPAIGHRLTPALPISAAPGLVVWQRSTRGKLAELRQQFGFGRLQLLKLRKVLDS